MKIHKVAQFGHVPAGTRLWLTNDQAASRAHQVSAVEPDKEPKDGRRLYTANGQLGFKAGEELAVDGDLDRGLETMLGIDTKIPGSATSEPEKAKGREPSKAKLDKAFADGEKKGRADAFKETEVKIGEARDTALANVKDQVDAARKEGRAEMLRDVEARNAVFDALDDAEANREGLAEDASDQAKQDADAAVIKAKAAVDALEPLEA